MTLRQALTDTLPRFLNLLPDEALERLDLGSFCYHDNNVLGLEFVHGRNWVSVEIGDKTLTAISNIEGSISTVFDSTELDGFQTVWAFDELLTAIRSL